MNDPRPRPTPDDVKRATKFLSGADPERVPRAIEVEILSIEFACARVEVERQKIVEFIRKRQREIRHDDRDGAIVLEDLARQIEENAHGS